MSLFLDPILLFSLIVFFLITLHIILGSLNVNPLQKSKGLLSKHLPASTSQLTFAIISDRSRLSCSGPKETL